jgi:hypothetical protein
MRLMSSIAAPRQHDAARRIATAGDGRVGLDFVDARHAELDPQRLPVKHQADDGIGESLADVRAIDVADRGRLPFARSR